MDRKKSQLENDGEAGERSNLGSCNRRLGWGYRKVFADKVRSSFCEAYGPFCGIHYNSEVAETATPVRWHLGVRENLSFWAPMIVRFAVRTAYEA